MSLKYQNEPLKYAQQYSELSLSKLEHSELKFVAELIRKHVQGTLTLDYGCGPSSSTLYLKALGYGLNVEGVDINPHMLEIARRNDPSGKYDLIENGKIPKQDNHYDFVYSSWVLLHSETKEELLKICKELARVLKVGGIFILVVNSEEHLNRNWLTFDTRFEMNKNVCSGSEIAVKYKDNDFVVYCYYWTTEDYAEALSKAGLTILSIDKHPGFDGDGNKINIPYATIFVAQK